MPPATAEAILGVDEGLLKTCRQYIQEIWYNTRALSIVSTAEGTERFHEDVTEALKMFSQHSPRLDTVAGIYSRAATWEDVNDMLSLRCGEHLVWWAVETLGRRWLENTEWQMVLRNRNLSDDEDDDDGNGNSKGGGQDEEANTSKGKEPVRRDQRGEDDDDPSKDNDTRALEWLPMCSRKELATELVSPLSGI
jgi:hypothetical protein